MTPTVATGSEKSRYHGLPGQADIWVLIMIEALTFSAYFVVYTIRFKLSPDLFLQSQAQLHLAYGVFNTLVLLASSWAVARCVQHSREGNYRAALRDCWLTIGGGVLFVGLKIYEWSVELGRGFTITTNEFFTFYYFLTAMHLLHVLVGFIALGVVVYQLKNSARRSQEVIETGATFWHMVDFLWVIIFTLLYVMR